LTYEDARDVVLVGHSYGGLVIAGVADRVTDRIGHLVYLDALVPRPGETLREVFSADGIAELDARAREFGDGWRVPPYSPDVFGVTAEADVAWMQPRLTDDPWRRSLEDPLPLLATPGAQALPRTYIFCVSPRREDRFADRARTEAGWRYRELPTGHDAMITAPEGLAALLLELA
jgi:pimeloyl-ACP methyl ester carboxylesterase